MHTRDQQTLTGKHRETSANTVQLVKKQSKICREATSSRGLTGGTDGVRTRKRKRMGQRAYLSGGCSCFPSVRRVCKILRALFGTTRLPPVIELHTQRQRTSKLDVNDVHTASLAWHDGVGLDQTMRASLIKARAKVAPPNGIDSQSGTAWFVVLQAHCHEQVVGILSL